MADMILMDVQMPGVDGLAATRAIRDIESAQGRRHTPVVALTAEASEAQVQRCMAAGCDAHLSKPISQASLLDAVSRFVAGRGLPGEVPSAGPTAGECREELRTPAPLGVSRGEARNGT